MVAVCRGSVQEMIGGIGEVECGTTSQYNVKLRMGSGGRVACGMVNATPGGGG